MGGEVLPKFPLSCLRAGGGRVSAHMREPRGWRRSSSRPWSQRPVSRWLASRFLSLKKNQLNKFPQRRLIFLIPNSNAEKGIKDNSLSFKFKVYMNHLSFY
ncbi:hypothetical protein Hanom_Chr08g00688651 [Helianthus anomalus]